MKKEIYYWSPYVGKIATVRSVINSMIGLKRYKGNYFRINLINCYGEWNKFRSHLKKNDINLLNLQRKFNFKINLYGFFLSRFVYFFTLIISYNKLKNLLIKKQPNFLIVHLLTYIPFFIYLNNKLKTKLILRIGYAMLELITCMLTGMVEYGQHCVGKVVS